MLPDMSALQSTNCCDTLLPCVQVSLTASQQAGNQSHRLQNDLAAMQQRLADSQQILDDTQVGLSLSVICINTCCRRHMQTTSQRPLCAYQGTYQAHVTVL